MTWHSAKSFVEKVGEKLVRDNVLVSSIAELVESGSLNDEEAAFMLVKILAADAEHSRKQLIDVALRVPPSMSFPLPASGEPGTAHFVRETRSTAMPEHSDNCPCWDCTLGAKRAAP